MIEGKWVAFRGGEGRGGWNIAVVDFYKETTKISYVFTFSDDFHRNKSWSTCLNSLNIRSDIWWQFPHKNGFSKSLYHIVSLFTFTKNRKTDDYQITTYFFLSQYIYACCYLSKLRFQYSISFSSRLIHVKKKLSSIFYINYGLQGNRPFSR